MSEGNELAKCLGALIQERRIKLGLSQEELADRSLLHRTYVSDVERGTRNISLKTLHQLAVALDTTTSSLIQSACSHAACPPDCRPLVYN